MAERFKSETVLMSSVCCSYRLAMNWTVARAPVMFSTRRLMFSRLVI